MYVCYVCVPASADAQNVWHRWEVAVDTAVIRVSLPRAGARPGRQSRPDVGSAEHLDGLDSLRVAMVVPPYFEVPPAAYGGVESVAADLTDALVERGHRVTLIAAGRSSNAMMPATTSSTYVKLRFMSP